MHPRASSSKSQITFQARRDPPLIIAVIPVYGVLMESLGRKTAMLVACFFYGLGTILCATASGMYNLIAARAVTGVSSHTLPTE